MSNACPSPLCQAERDLLARAAAWPDYPTEQQSRYEIWWVFGWEYDLSAFMSRIVFGGVLERHPALKFLIHHGGSMVPHFAGRVGPGWDQLGERTPVLRPERTGRDCLLINTSRGTSWRPFGAQ